MKPLSEPKKKTINVFDFFLFRESDQSTPISNFKYETKEIKYKKIKIAEKACERTQRS